MAIPDNYIDKISKDGDSRIISPSADKVRVNNENFQGTDLDGVLNEAAQAITSLQSALNTLIGSGNVQGAIDTFNEVKAFLNGIDTSDPTLANQLLTLNNSISAVQTSLAAKANSADVYTKAQTDAAIQEAVEDLGGGTVESVTVNGTKHTPDANGDVNLGTIQGEKGDKGDKGDTLLVDGDFNPITDIVNDTTTGGTNKAWSAEMGKMVSAQVDALEDAVEEMEDGAGYDISIVGTALVITSRNTPSVNVGEVSNHNVSCKAGNTATASFYVSGRKLVSPVQIAVSDATNWQVSPASISPVDGKVGLTLVTITYRPAAGTASGTTHNCNVTVACGGVTYGTIAMQGTVAAAPSIVLTPATLNIGTAENTPATATINVKGAALEGDIALAISGTGFTLSANTVSKADAESAAGADVTVTFDGSASGTATITASATGATDVTAAVSGTVVARKADGDTFTVDGLLYTVLADTSTVSVKQTSTTVPSGAVTIPTSVNDENGLSYNVKSIPADGFKGNTAITSLTIQEGMTSISKDAIRGMSAMRTLWLPDSLTSLGNNNLHSCTSLNNPHLGSGITRLPEYCFGSAGSGKTVVIPDTVTSIGNYVFSSTTFSRIDIGAGLHGMTSANPKFSLANGGIAILRSTTMFDKLGYPFAASNYTAPYKSLGTLYVPDDLVATYKAAAGWGTADSSGNCMFPDEGQIKGISELPTT